jgi:putative hydroxymethylpyrimidine transporter CytX
VTATDHRPTPSATADAPLTLTTEPPRVLGLADQVALWGSLGVSLLLPVAAVFVLRPFGFPELSLAAALTAVLVGSVVGSALLGLAAVPGSRTGAPAMVLLRGLFGRTGSYLPTALNLLQCVGWASLEVLIIAAAAARLTAEGLRPLYIVAAGVLATLMAVRPLRAVGMIRRYAVWLVLLATAYLLIRVVQEGLPDLGAGSWSGFWAATDVVVALPVSWAPLVADYSRHSRTDRAAFGGAFIGYGLASVGYFTLGVLALVTVVGADSTGSPYDVIGALLAVPAGAVALAILAVDEIDEAFADIYSTAMSAHNVLPRLDRRWLAVGVGVVAVAVALMIDVVAYESFLLLIGSVFVPLFAVVVVEFFVVRRGRAADWDVSGSARGHWLLPLPWALGFVAYQLINPGAIETWAAWWTDLRAAVGFAPAAWMSASLLSFAVAAAGTIVVRLPVLLRAKVSA